MSGRPIRPSLVALAALLAACGAGEGRAVTGPDLPPAPARYALILASAPADLGAMVVAVPGGGPKSLAFTMDAGIRRMALPGDGDGSWRAVILGRPPVGPIGTITLLSSSGVAPVAVVIEAAADASGGYRTIAPSSISLTVTRID